MLDHSIIGPPTQATEPPRSGAGVLGTPLFEKSVFSLFFLHFLVIYYLVIGLNWLVNTLELLLILFSVT